MAESLADKEEEEEEEEREIMEEGESERKTTEDLAEIVRRKEKRKAKKKMKRKQVRKEMAEKEREEEEARLNDPEEQRKLRMMEEEEKERMERDRKEFEERERAWIEAMERKKKEEEEEEERREKALEEASRRQQVENENELNEDDDWEYVEEGPAEIIWQGNEIIVKKKKVKVPKKIANHQNRKDNADRPTSNPLPPQSESFADFKNASVLSAEQMIENVAQQVPNFGTEQDKAHCPFHLKTGACRFGQRCSRVHFYPDKSCTLLMRNMYNGPGLAWEQDEGLEYTDEEVERCYEEFYEDVHTEFLKFGEIVNFKVCRNGSFHLRGNVYIQYRSLDSAVLASHSANGRYFAGKQVRCEFINVTKWKVAICGEYMKSRFKTCSHGTACNFIHCFRNPGGDYEWADIDKPPPKYWVRKMAALFGNSDEAVYKKEVEQENYGQLRHSSNMLTDVDRCYPRRSKSREFDYLNSGGSRRRNDSNNNAQKTTQWRWHTSNNRKRMEVLDEDMHEENMNLKGTSHRKSRTHDTDSEGEWLDKDGGRDRYRDRHYGSERKSSRHRNRDGKHRTHEAESEGGYSDRSEDRETHDGHARKSSRHSGKAKFLDDCEDQEKVGGDWSDRDGDQETRDARMTKSSRHRRKVEHTDDHEDSKNRTHDTDGEWSDGEGDTDRDRHHRKRSESSRHLWKVGHSHDCKDSKYRSHDPEGEWSDRDTNRDGHHHKRRKSSGRDRVRGDSKNRADDTDLSYDWLDSDGEKHHSQTRKRTGQQNEVSDFSDDEGEPAKKLKDKFHNRESSIEKLHDLESSYNSDKYIDKQDRWEPD